MGEHKTTERMKRKRKGKKVTEAIELVLGKCVKSALDEFTSQLFIGCYSSDLF